MTLDEYEKLVSDAAPGPWEWMWDDEKCKSDIVAYEDGMSYSLISRDSGVYGPDVATCEFIIASREMVPKLIAAVRALREIVAYGESYNSGPDAGDLVRVATDALAALEADPCAG
jgi:hypothetical protein